MAYEAALVCLALSSRDGVPFGWLRGSLAPTCKQEETSSVVV